MGFHPLDLIAPWGIGIGAFVLCVFAAIKAKKTPPPGRIICVVTGVVFLGLIPAFYSMRGSVTKADYETKQGLFVTQDHLNKCEKADVEEAVDWVLAFWAKEYDKEKLAEVPKGKQIICIDDEKIKLMSGWAAGTTMGKRSIVAWRGKKETTRSLIIHELSHQILMEVGDVQVDWDASNFLEDNSHHRLFKSKGLGH